MTRQEMFDVVYKGLKAQGFQRSYDKEAEACRYRGPNNMKCAVGHLLTDEQYKVDMEGYGVDVFSEYKLPRWMQNEKAFLGDLQQAHDCAPRPDLMESYLVAIAKKYRLTVPE